MFDVEAIARGFSGLVGGGWVDATLAIAAAPVLDAGGSIATPGGVIEAAILVQIDASTQAMRADADFQETDIRLLVLGPDALKIDDRITVDAGPHAGRVYALRSAIRDPATLGWDCRARVAGHGA